MASIKIKTIKWWEHILLWFYPAQIVADGTYRLIYKKMRGHMYVIKEYYVA